MPGPGTRDTLCEGRSFAGRFGLWPFLEGGRKTGSSGTGKQGNGTGEFPPNQQRPGVPLLARPTSIHGHVTHEGRGRSPLILLPLHTGQEGGPNVGVSRPMQMISSSYIAALNEVGATAVLMPLGTRLPENLNWVAGLLLPGGGDVEPRRYGADPHPTSEWDSDLDFMEFHLLELALRAGIPVLGICRGLQVLNVYFGGTLVQDLPTARAAGVEHPHGGPRDDLAHELHVEPGSRLHEILGGEKFMVNSLHHQGIDELAPRLRASAHSDDGIVEGVEARDGSWVFGVQFHPEELFPQHQFSRRLFQTFVEQCAGAWT